MSVHSDLRTQIITRMNLITDIGAINNRERYSSTRAQFLEQFATDVAGSQLLRGWVVTLKALQVDEEAPYGTLPNIFRTYQFEIFGMHGFKDSADTETTMIGLVESVINKLDEYGSPDTGTFWTTSTLTVERVTPCRVPAIGVMQFDSGVMVNYAEIQIDITVRKPYTP